jgi:hypothetical protein
VSVQEISLAPGQPLQTRLDATTGLVSLMSDRPIELSVQIERLAPEGNTTTFEHSNIVVDGVAAQLDVGSWTGGDTPLTIIVDKDGDGFANDTPQQLENNYVAVRLFFPMIRGAR